MMGTEQDSFNQNVRNARQRNQVANIAQTVGSVNIAANEDDDFGNDECSSSDETEARGEGYFANQSNKN